MTARSLPGPRYANSLPSASTVPPVVGPVVGGGVISEAPTAAVMVAEGEVATVAEVPDPRLRNTSKFAVGVNHLRDALDAR